MPDGPVVISLLAADRVAAALGEIAPRLSIDGHPLEVRRIESIQEGDECHILFVGARARARTNEILAALAGRSVLTISDARGFARKGGMVEFTRKGQRLAFEVHQGTALRAELRISARLLALASAVYGDAPAGVP